jgi:CRP-like cAMP-binding protein
MSDSSESQDPAHLPSFLKNTPCFAQLSPEAISLLANQIGVRVLEAGEVLANEGEPGDALFLVKSGSLTITRKALNGHPTLRIAKVKTGEIAGELSLLTGHPRAAGSISRGDGGIRRLDGRAVATVPDRKRN